MIEFNSGFEIIRFSDLNYNEITLEIQYQGEQIAQLNKDKGINMLEIELLTDYIDVNFSPKFLLNDFLIVLNKAKKILEEQ